MYHAMTLVQAGRLEKINILFDCAFLLFFQKCNHIQGPVYCLNEEYPIPAFCFEIHSDNSITKMAKEIYKLLEHLLKKSIAHNIFMTRGLSVEGSQEEVLRVLVWPRRSTSGVKQLTAFNVALLELSGWFPVYSKL